MNAGDVLCSLDTREGLLQLVVQEVTIRLDQVDYLGDPTPRSMVPEADAEVRWTLNGGHVHDYHVQQLLPAARLRRPPPDVAPPDSARWFLRSWIRGSIAPSAATWAMFQRSVAVLAGSPDVQDLGLCSVACDRAQLLRQQG